MVQFDDAYRCFLSRLAVGNMAQHCPAESHRNKCHDDLFVILRIVKSKRIRVLFNLAVFGICRE